MKAVMLAAGLARRLYGDENSELPKALLRFDSRTLLERNIEVLRYCGIDELILVVGHRREDLLAEAEKVAPAGFVRSIFNPRYREGPIISLWQAREVLREGNDILFMDADVLYHPSMLQRLVEAPAANCFLVDRNYEPGDEPVKLCIRDGLVVDFGKQVSEPHDNVGEWPGFMKMSPEIADMVATATERYVETGNDQLTYEEAMRDVLKASPAGTFGYEDITGAPWIEIDFPSDLIRAEKIIYPKVAEYFPDIDLSPAVGGDG